MLKQYDTVAPVEEIISGLVQFCNFNMLYINDDECGEYTRIH